MTEYAKLVISVDSTQAKKADNDLGALDKSASRLTSGLGKMIAPLVSVAAAMAALNKASDVQRQFDVLNAGLITATGSSEKAASAFKALQEFAQKTPYDLNQAVKGFTQLVNLGLTPSEKALMSYGNTASAMSKDLNQMIEAVADAATGEFERLKEFGIKAKVSGDQVSLIFQGVTTKVGNNAKEIESFLIKLGETKFGDAMSLRMATLDGAVSNLGDTWENTFRLVNDAGLGDVMRESVNDAAEALGELNNMLASGEMEGYLEASSIAWSGWAIDITESIRQVSVFLDGTWDEWGEGAKDASKGMYLGFKEFPAEIRAYFQEAAVEAISFVDRLVAQGAYAKDAIAAIFDNTTLDDARKKYDATVTVSNQVRQDMIDDISQEKDATINAVNEKIESSKGLRHEYDLQQKAAKALTADRLAQYKTKGDGSSASSSSAVEKAAKAAQSLVATQAKAEKSFLATTAIVVSSTNAMADAYLSGADSVRELAIQQKIEEELLKTGAGARDAVTAAVNREADAKDRLDIDQSIASMRVETSNTLAQATATLQGADALETFNIQKSMSIALSGKKIDIGSKEYEQLLEQTKAQLAANKALEQASKVEGIVDRLNPQIKLLKDFTAEQDALNAAIARYPENAALYQDALAKLGQEYEVNQSKATIWGQLTEGAVDRIDGVFADAWANIGSGANSLWDSLVKGAKQAFGEIAHMLTTKPLLASISNWLTGTDNGQGLSAVWGKLLGSATGQQGGSGGFAGMGSNLVSMGKSIYQAYSAITGVGSSVASGYATGGVSGAIQGGAGYYGNMLSNIGSTLSNGFSSLVSTFTGVTAAQTAATIGAQGITSAALSGAVSQGAAAIGTQLSTGVATTTAATYAAAEAGAAATAASLGGQISAAVSSAAAMWPLAVIMGMYQSGKLYDAGVRPDAGEIMDSGGKTALGKVAMAPGAAMSGFFEAQDKVLSKVVGGKWAAILSGSTLHQAVTKYVGEKLFGGAWQTKDGGISLGVENGEFDAQQYVYQKKKGGLFSSSKKRTRYSELDAETEDALGAAYNEKLLGSMGLFSALGVQLSDAVFDGLNVAVSQISTQGKTPEAIQTELDKWFTNLGDSAVSAINSATSSGLDGFTLDGLTTFVNNLYSVNTTFDKFGVKMVDFSVAGGRAVDYLVAMAGGIDQFNTNISSYYDNFTSDTQKSADSLEAVRAQFVSLGMVLPETESAYKAMLKQLDMTTGYGQTMFNAMTANAEAAASAYAILEQRQSDYYGAFYSEAENTARSIAVTTAQIKEMGVTLPDSRDGFRDMVEALDQTTATGKAMYDTLMSVAGAAGTVFDALESQAQAAAEVVAAAAQAAADAQANYYNLFTSDTQKAADTVGIFSEQMNALGLALPASHDGFSAIVGSIDKTTASGAQMFNSLMGIASSASAALTIIESQAKEAAAAAAAAAQAIADALNAGVTNSFSAVQRAISAQQKAATDAYNATTASLSDMAATASDNVSGLTSVSNNLSAALKSLRGDSDDAVKMLRAQAQATLQGALATARSGGSLSGFTGLEDALDTVSNNNTDLYGSMEDFARDQGRTANVVAELNGINGKQLTSAEATVKTLKDQIDLVKDQFDQQMAVYDQQLEFAQAQLDAINGTDNSVKSVVDAIKAMNASVVAALGAISFPAASNTPQNNGSIVDTLYQSVLGRDADADGKAYWTDKLQSGALSYQQIAESLANGALAFDSGSYSGPVSQDALAASKAAAQKYLDSLKVPGFAAGGDFGGGLRLVGENGPELEVTGPSRIFNANQTAAMLNGGGNSELIAEVRLLRTENRQAQFQIVKLNQKMEQTLNQWNGEGMPQEREYAL